ncbi:MAG: hypothetical protein V8S87_00530 [Oscillospiraceae bacterium]
MTDTVIALPVAGTLHEVLNSDDERFGGASSKSPRDKDRERTVFGYAVFSKADAAAADGIGDVCELQTKEEEE